jgi:ketohexokinase
MVIFVVCGGVYLDEIHEVPHFPEEDSCVRAAAIRKRRGGNAASTACVLAQLKQSGDVVRWMGPLPAEGDDAAVAFVLDDMSAHGVDTSFRELVATQPGDSSPLGVPSATVIVSQARGTRTIISSRRNLRELSPEHFALRLAEIQSHAAVPWVHIECRTFDSARDMARELRSRPQQRAEWKLSIEIEKPAFGVDEVLELLSLANVAFFSSAWVECHYETLAKGTPAPTPVPADTEPKQPDWHEHVALRTLRSLAKRASSTIPRTGAVWICAWGSLGAFALNVSALAAGDALTSTAAQFQPASKVDKVVDSTGAGDTFNGACIAALGRGATVDEVLRVGCTVAGLKVGQDHFGGLAYPARKRDRDDATDFPHASADGLCPAPL